MAQTNADGQPYGIDILVALQEVGTYPRVLVELTSASAATIGINWHLLLAAYTNRHRLSDDETEPPARRQCLGVMIRPRFKALGLSHCTECRRCMSAA